MFIDMSQEPRRQNTASVCITNGLRHAQFTDIRLVFEAVSVLLRRGTTLIRYSRTPIRPSHVFVPFFH